MRRRIKKRYIILLLLLLPRIVFYIRGFIPYAVKQDVSEIVHMELLKRENDDDEFELLVELPEEEWDEVINALADFSFTLTSGDGICSDFGSLAIRITYRDGACEMIGVTNNRYIGPDGKDYGSHIFEYQDFLDLFRRYTDEPLPSEWNFG